MKIKVADLEPNPYRKMKEYPIDREKVEALKNSIKEKTFWDNILVRPHPTKKGKYQLAYGHHRWIALKELGIKETGPDVPVRDFDDALMLQSMAEENLDWSTNPAVILQTIRATKEYLDNILKISTDWQEFNRSCKNTRPIFESEPEFRSVKGKNGVGIRTIRKFLGSNWKYWVVRYATEILNDNDVEKKAVSIIPTMRQAKSFKESVNKYKIPKPKQIKIAKKIKKDETGFRDIHKLVRRCAKPELVRKEEDKEVKQIKDLIEKIDSQSRALYNSVLQLRRYMKELDIKQLRGVNVWLSENSVKKLTSELIRLKEQNNETNSESHG